VGAEQHEFRFKSEGLVQTGTIVFPKQPRPIAAIVLLHGSGKTDRRSLLWLARLFAADGFAAAVYDKRGVGQSEGTFVGGPAAGETTNLELLSRDAAAAAAHMTEHPRVKGLPVGYVGLSQGSWVGALAAHRSPRPSFMVFLSGPSVTVSEETHFSAMAEADPDFWATHSREEVAEHMKTVRYAENDFDPRPMLEQLGTPVLWAFGGRDNVMPVDLSISRLKQLIEKGQRNFGYRLYSELGHELVLPQVGWRGLYVSQPYDDVVDWLKTQSVGQ
jgi:alpha-beta hydrolase superfamily lysophospholipase